MPITVTEKIFEGKTVACDSTSTFCENSESMYKMDNERLMHKNTKCDSYFYPRHFLFDFKNSKFREVKE